MRNHLLPSLLRLIALIGLSFGGLGGGLPAAEQRLLILHTNDIHDHVRPGYDGVGGLPWVAQYVADVRAQRPDVLVVDAGDIVEKGDLVAHRSGGDLTCRLLQTIGYDAITIGNHDYDQGLEILRHYAKLLGQPWVCLNLVDAAGQPYFDPYREVRIGDLRIAVIGLLVPQAENTLDFAASGQRLAELARELSREHHLVIALCHHASAACMAWSRMAPDVDIFVSGHSHEFITEPVVAPGTGALIVQAGCYAKAVGRLEVAVDLVTKRVRLVEGGLVVLDHGQHQPAPGLAATVAAEEKRLAPEAGEWLCDNPKALGAELAWLAAAAIRNAAGVEVGFCHPGYILRDALPAGPVDINAIFITGGQRGERIITVALTGREIEAYAREMEQADDPTAWAGFSLAAGSSDNLDPERTYRVAMPIREWSKRYLRAVGRSKNEGALKNREFVVMPATTTYTDAIVALLRALSPEQRDVHKLAAAARLAGGR